MTDFIEAARSQLATWLTTQLAPQFPTLTVSDQWPAPGRELALPAMAALVIGDPDVEAHSPMTHSTTPTNHPNGLVTYSYGRIMLSMQLDLWAATQEERRSLAQATSDAVNVNPIYSLPVLGAPPDFRRSPGLMLRLADLYDVMADYKFERLAGPIEDSDAAQTNEWRATFAGGCLFHAVTQEACTLLQRIVTNLTLNGGPPETRILT